ncbi:unnamed protein product [Calypogeia fissa]
MVHGYVKDFLGFQLLLVDDEGQVQPLTDNTRSRWDPCWVEANAAFEAECDANLAFLILKDRMFPVGDGNHRLFSWMQISELYPQEAKYHPRVIAKFLSGTEDQMLEIIAALQAFNSVTASHVEHSWIVEADHTSRILSRKLESYKAMIDEDNFNLLLNARQKTKNKAWYSENMTLDGCKYVLASAHIKAGIQRLQSKFALAKASGSPVSKDDQRTELKAVVKTHIDEWKTKVPKMATMTNPEYEGFFEKCVDLYNWCEKTRKEGQLEDDQVKKNVQCGLDKCRIYAFGSVSNTLRCNLLEASVKPDLRDVYQHPSKLAESDIKAWISRHGVWESVLELCHAYVCASYFMSAHLWHASQALD